MSFGYGVTKERTISEHVLKLAMRYAHQRLSKWCDLDISETTCYGVVRSALHNRIAEVCDSCGVEYEYSSSPMLNDEIWKSISNEYIDENKKWHGQMFCKDCIEKKLGRKITIEDLSQYADTVFNESTIESQTQKP